MDSLRSLLKIVFSELRYRRFHQRLKSEEINTFSCLDLILGSEKQLGGNNEKLWVDLTSRYLKSYCKSYTDDENYSLAAMSLSYFESIDGNSNNKNILNFFLHFANDIMYEDSGVPKIYFDKLFKWNETTSFLGEDCFTTSFLANLDIRNNYQRKSFDWSFICEHDSEMVNQFIKKGLPELHFHLKGSSANFDINWLCLMNHIKYRSKEFSEFSNLLSTEVFHSYERAVTSLKVMCEDAAVIRFYFFLKLISPYGSKDECFSYVKVLSEFLKNTHRIYSNNIYIQGKIDTYRFAHKTSRIDYVCNKSIDYKPCSFIEGERKLMYHIFQHIIRTNNQFDSYLFYSYILIKNKLRKEMIQINQDIGFSNFSKYERRKEVFIEDYPDYKDLLIKNAIKGAFKTNHVNYLEARITPKTDYLDLAKTVLKNDRILKNNDPKEENRHFIHARLIKNNLNTVFKSIPSCLRDSIARSSQNMNCEFYYILHFIKLKDDTSFEENSNFFFQTARHTKLRALVKKQVLSFIKFKRRIPNSLSKKIIGLDAANSEIDARPEVFAQAFRYAKLFSNIYYTFHAGEDFIDVVDGLRAIDETILFLGLNRGDRIGHALALGINPFSYYEKRRLTIYGKKQTILDNLVWANFRAGELGLEIPQCLKSFFEQKISNLLYNLGYRNLRTFAIYDYYESLLLRGDDPYSSLDSKSRTSINIINTWSKVNFNTNSCQARYNSKACSLYQIYHFDKQVRLNGEQYIEIKFPKEYVKFVYSLQERMMDYLNEKNIAIECNPTSNLKISIFEQYDQHPIFRFFNEGIRLENQKRRCLNVSINTDDLGVFSTSLPNEYSLLALALQKSKDKDGNLLYSKYQIRNWLSSVRMMGNSQRFIKK